MLWNTRVDDGDGDGESETYFKTASIYVGALRISYKSGSI